MFKTWLWTTAVLLLVLAGGYWYLQSGGIAEASPQSSDTLVQTVSVQRGNLAATVSVVGELDAPENQELTFDRLDGATPLLSLDVAAGHVVEAGALLATIDPTPYQQALEMAHSNLAEAEANLAQLLTPPTTLVHAQADLVVAQAELAQRQAEDALATLNDVDIADLQAKVADARLQLSEAQANLAELKVNQAEDTTLSKLWDAESVQGAEYTRLANETYSDPFYQDRLRLTYNKMMDAQDSRVSEQIQQQVDLLNAEAGVRRAQRTLVDAQDTLAAARIGPDELDLALARQAVARAQAAVAQAQDDRDTLEAGPDGVAVASAQTAVADAQQSLSEAEEDLASAVLRAPFAGTVLQTQASLGSRITSSSPIVTLANLKQLQVAAAVDETTIRQVESGQSAQISFDAFPGQMFSGSVLSVPLQGTLQGDVMVYQVPVSLTGAEELPLRVGMTANVAINVGEATNVLLVPSMAVQSGGRGNQVLVAGRTAEVAPTAVAVEVGLSNGVYTEIVSGLSEGDQVLVELSTASSDSGFPRGFSGGGFPGGTIRLPRN